VATTPSAKLGIPLPVAGSQEPFTVAAYNNAINTLDGVAGATVVTSTTRPTSPFSGQLIFETDTNKSLVWDGVAWNDAVPVPPVPALGGLSDVTVTSATTGDTLVYDGSDWTNQPLTTRRNLLYNGAMQVHQRGTSATGITAAGYYTADRWQTSNNAMGVWTQTIENDAPAGTGFRKSLKMLCTTADAAPSATDELRLNYRLEGQDLQNIKKGTSAAEQLTFSFWVKSNVTGTYVLNPVDVDNTRQVGAYYTINAANTWEKKVITFPADMTGAFDNDNLQSLLIIWHLGAGANRTSGTFRTTWTADVIGDTAVGQVNLAAATNNYWQITGVQLEIGPVATPFEFKPYGQELAECQRYYFRISGGGATSPHGNGHAQSTTQAECIINHPVIMRANPSSLEFSTLALGDGVTARAVTNIIILNTHINKSLVQVVVASGLTQFRPQILINNLSTSGFFGMNAEL
jgi:hypothetical protein